MTDVEKRDFALSHLKKTTISYPEYQRRCREIPGYADEPAHWKLALEALGEIGKTPPPPPANHSFWASRGLWTGDDPSAADSLRQYVDWVCVQVPHYVPGAVTWEAQASSGPFPGSPAYIAQAEGAGQLEAARRVGAGVQVPKALVTNLFFDSSMASVLVAEGWSFLLEAYQGINPNASPLAMAFEAQQRGIPADRVFIVVECSGEGSRRSLAAYLPELHNFSGWSIWLAEGLTPADRLTLASLT